MVKSKRGRARKHLSTVIATALNTIGKALVEWADLDSDEELSTKKKNTQVRPGVDVPWTIWDTEELERFEEELHTRGIHNIKAKELQEVFPDKATKDLESHLKVYKKAHILSANELEKDEESDSDEDLEELVKKRMKEIVHQ